MIEQLTPVEFWDNQDVISVSNLDSKGGIVDGIGDNYRSYVADVMTPQSVAANGLEQATAPYVPKELFNITYPVTFASPANTRFSATHYELRSHGTGPPFTAPSMTTLVPRSQWKTSYQWFTPKNQN
jgi:hypothetical protein